MSCTFIRAETSLRRLREAPEIPAICGRKMVGGDADEKGDGIGDTYGERRHCGFNKYRGQVVRFR